MKGSGSFRCKVSLLGNKDIVGKELFIGDGTVSGKLRVMSLVVTGELAEVQFEGTLKPNSELRKSCFTVKFKNGDIEINDGSISFSE